MGFFKQRNGDAIAQQYAGSEAFHKAQVDKIGQDWKAVRHNIALVAVKRYLSNILTDYEKQKTISLFLGEFKPDPKNLANCLWDDDAMIPYPSNESDVTQEKPLLFPKLDKNQRLIQPIYQLYNENNAFLEDKVIILGGEAAILEESAKENPLKVPIVVQSPRQSDNKSEDDFSKNYLPSNLNFLANFRQLDKNFAFEFI